jgi:hypothetical protein
MSSYFGIGGLVFYGLMLIGVDVVIRILYHFHLFIQHPFTVYELGMSYLFIAYVEWLCKRHQGNQRKKILGSDPPYPNAADTRLGFQFDVPDPMPGQLHHFFITPEGKPTRKAIEAKKGHDDCFMTDLFVYLNGEWEVYNDPEEQQKRAIVELDKMHAKSHQTQKA